MEEPAQPASYGATDGPADEADAGAAEQEPGSNVEEPESADAPATEQEQEPDADKKEDEEVFVTIQVDEADTARPTLAPIGARLKRNAQIAYNPFDWSQTTWVLKGRPYVTYFFYLVSLLGALLVYISHLHRFNDGSRHCRAWCTVFSLSTEPHSYIGFILFLLMSFRTANSYKNYVAGQVAFYEIKTQMRRFTAGLLAMAKRDAIPRNRRARMLGYLICFPFALTSELRMERRFDKDALKHVSDADLNRVMESPSMTQFILDTLTSMVRLYVPAEEAMAKRAMYNALSALYKPYSETERIQFNPMGFAYVVHIRLLLLIYLTTLPLAFVEKLGFATILVHWVITYALMSLEMLAVEVENPFGHEGSDLRLYQYNILMRDSVLESWEDWERNVDNVVEDEELIGCCSEFGKAAQAEQEENESKWFFFY